MYDFTKPGWSSSVGHFTQVVWDSSTELGMGLAVSPSNGRILCVAQYNQAGNWEGEFATNVLKPKA